MSGPACEQQSRDRRLTLHESIAYPTRIEFVECVLHRENLNGRERAVYVCIVPWEAAESACKHAPRSKSMSALIRFQTKLLVGRVCLPVSSFQQLKTKSISACLSSTSGLPRISSAVKPQ